MKHILARYIKSKNAATAIEYGLIAAGIALAIVSSVFLFGDGLQSLFAELPSALEAAGNEVETGR
jgi:pilus assembly protein Flp/PilA